MHSYLPPLTRSLSICKFPIPNGGTVRVVIEEWRLVALFCHHDKVGTTEPRQNSFSRFRGQSVFVSCAEGKLSKYIVGGNEVRRRDEYLFLLLFYMTCVLVAHVSQIPRCPPGLDYRYHALRRLLYVVTRKSDRGGF